MLRDLPPELVRPASALIAVAAAYKPETPLPAWLLVEVATLGLPDDALLDEALAWLGREELIVPGENDALVIAPAVADLAFAWQPGPEIALLVQELVAADMAGRLIDAVAIARRFDARLMPHAQHLAEAALAGASAIAPTLAAALGQLRMEQGQLEQAEHMLRAALAAFAQHGVAPGEESVVASSLAALGAIVQWRGDRRLATSYLARALRRYEAALGPQHLQTRATALALAAVRDVPPRFGQH
jgi:tetratricopeptide (TPR) repeat protein